MISRKAILKPAKSVTNPKSGGTIAPPTIIVHNIPDPCGLRLSNPSIDRVKIVGNMIELKRPTIRIDHIEINPLEKMEIKIKAMAPMAKEAKTLDGSNFLVRNEPMNLPIIAPDQ